CCENIAAEDESCCLYHFCTHQSKYPLMYPRNSSHAQPFLLSGLPGMAQFHHWVFLPFGLMYLVAVLGNGTILLDPMHCFLAMLAAIDVVMVTSVVPKLLGIFWFHSNQIGFTACFVQMFFVHSSTAEESGVLLAMAFDRYVAICHPLRYRMILNRQTVARICLAIVVRGFLVMVPLSGMVTKLPYCHSLVVPHSYCEHMAVTSLACADPNPSRLYSVSLSSLIVGMDTAFIAASYLMILKAVLGKDSCRRAFSTCGCHMAVMLLFYIPGLVSIYVQQFSRAVSVRAQVLLADLYLTLPAVLNPIIYSMRNRRIRKAIKFLLWVLFDSMHCGVTASRCPYFGNNK
uniref:G-protein coupled receptors family 1 profile domain-containing protein n=1 Tax=Coturnix japonica TaxID=93934 RepID=A0A8C2SZQ5_COTJA